MLPHNLPSWRHSVALRHQVERLITVFFCFLFQGTMQHSSWSWAPVRCRHCCSGAWQLWSATGCCHCCWVWSSPSWAASCGASTWSSLQPVSSLLCLQFLTAPHRLCFCWRYSLFMPYCAGWAGPATLGHTWKPKCAAWNTKWTSCCASRGGLPGTWMQNDTKGKTCHVRTPISSLFFVFSDFYLDALRYLFTQLCRSM